jgi:spermidine synthase
VESTVALAVEPNGYAFIVNGKSDGSARGDAGTQVMLGLLAALGHPSPKRSLVVGLGTGSSAGWLGALPSMERVDVVELEPLVVEVARASEAVNHDVLNNPRVQITIADARETLLTGRDRYDVIASEPSNPFRAGIASLFTVEFYRAARNRLTDDGVFAQWVQGYEIDARTLRTIYATLAEVFPQIDTWQTNHGDLVLIAATRSGAWNAAALRARIAEEPYKSAIANTWRAADIHGVLAHYLANDAFARAMADAARGDVNTDDRNRVEFGLARSVGRSVPNLVAEVRSLARAAKASRPRLDTDAGISWPAVDTAWGNFVGWDLPFATAPAVSAEEVARRRALQRYYLENDAAAARDIWRGQAERSRDPQELAMAADLEADAGSDMALPLIDRLRSFQPVEADIVLASLRFRQSRLDEAATALVTAFVRLRMDPWPQIRFVQKALTLAEAVANGDRTTTRRLFDALEKPFSLRVQNTPRLVTRVDLAAQIDPRGMCQSVFGELEPYIPWTQALLTMRRDCYQATNDPRLPTAVRELETFFAGEPLPLAPR